MLTCIRSKRQRDAAEYALRTIQSSCIRPYIKTIYLYGSCARGEEKYSSDVDLFLELVILILQKTIFNILRLLMMRG